MRSKFWIILEALMLMLWIVVTIIFLYIAYTDGIKCVANPMMWGVKMLSERNEANLTCLCEYDNEPNYQVFIDSKHWELREKGIFGEQNNDYSLPQFNISLIKG